MMKQLLSLKKILALAMVLSVTFILLGSSFAFSAGEIKLVPQVLGKKPTPAKTLKVGLVQFAFEVGDVEANLAEADKLIDEAAKQGARLIVLPELWSIGYGPEDPTSFGESKEDGPTVAFMKKKAKQHRVYICGGYAEKGLDGKVYNSAAFIDPNGVNILNHRKVMLYTPLGEDKIWAAGNRFDVVDTAFGRVGILICYDGDFPEPWRILAANKGADLIIHPTAYETPCEDAGWWDKLYEAGAMQNACWLVSANMAGQLPNGGNFFGGSRVIDPMGNTLASAPFIKPDEKAESYVLVYTMDFAQGLADGREHNGSIVTDRKVDVFHANGL